MHRSPTNHRAFTLIELLLVIGIISILASIVIIAINPSYQLGKARNARRQHDLNAILNAFSQYAVDHGGVYQSRLDPPPTDCTIPLAPAPAKRLCISGVTDVTCDFGAADDGEGCVYIDSLTPTYLVAIPIDPQETVSGDEDLQSDYAVQLTSGGTRLNVVAPNTEVPPGADTLIISR